MGSREPGSARLCRAQRLRACGLRPVPPPIACDGPLTPKERDVRSWHPLTVTPAFETQTWRVRPWIRIAALLAIIGMATVWFDVIRRARLGETPVGEIRNGYLILGAISLVIWLLAFRPNVRLDGTGRVVVRTPSEHRPSKQAT